MATKVSAAEGTSASSPSTSTGGLSGNITPARRLRTRTSTGGNVSGGDSAKKSSNNSSGSERSMSSSDFNKNNGGSNNTAPTSAIAASSGDDKLSSNSCSSTNFTTGSGKKYHNSCPHPTNDRGRGKLLTHLQPHSSSTFNLNKTEEFHFDTPVECPVFRPTHEEFKNPLAYISKIRPIAEKCGIAKILPPESWSPPFAVDVDKLKFTPRVQRLNELEAKTRVKLNFLDQIAKFWELQGSSLKIPMVERKALDLYTLHRVVQEEGGMEQTTKERKWAKVANRMSYPSSKSVGATLKAHYERILHPFEVYTSGKVLGAGAGASTSVDAGKLEDGTDYKTHEIPTRQQITPPNENNARRSKRFANSSANCGLNNSASRNIVKIETKEDFKRDLLNCFNAAGTSSSANGARGQAGATSSGNSIALKKAPDPQIVDPLMKYICHICNRGDVEESMLLCDGCDDSYHTFCLLPPLSSIPKGEWLCPRCVVEEVSKPTEAFGFEQAEREYTLQQFGQMADQFKTDYFRKPVHLVPTNLVEREFWRIVSSIDEDVTVEYGADLHTMDHGSGFPTKSSLYLLPGDQEYAESSWNLNNLPLLEDSILGHINADISGMNAPWMYVGMCFAAFCWHNEDHWSYSINYLHWGEPKTWYGVPGYWAEQFEETMKQAAPELFASQPDLLHQLVTIMNPNILMNNGVPVYRTDQNAGEFVITFPRAYHAGFNQGYNFAEAVNFAPADWLKMGRECVNHYSMLRRFCVFSHDELVCKMALEPAKLTFGIATACYIDMAEMVDSEKKLRKSLLEWGVTRAERKAFELVPDDERHCQECNTTCFLSAVSCECTKSIVCLRHYTILCDCIPEKHSLLYRYTLDEMPLMLQKLKAKAQSFERWLSRCRDIMDANTPTSAPLAELQELCKEAEIKKFPSSLLIDRLNSAIVEAEKCVTVIQQLGINKVRTRSDNNQEAAQYKLTMEELELFVQEINNLCCIIEEGTSVRELLSLGKQFLERANVLLNRSIHLLEEPEIDQLISEGNSLRIELPLMNQLYIRLKQIKWYKRSQGLRNGNTKLTYSDIKNLLNSAAAEVDPTDPIIDKEMRKLQEIGAAIEAWEKQASRYFRCTTQQHELADIEQFLKTAADLEGQVPSYITLKDALRKAKEWLHSVEQLQTNDHFPYCHTLEAIVQRGKCIPIQLEELKRMQGHLNSAHEWKDNTARVFLKKQTFYTLLEVLMPRSESVIIDSDLKQPFEDGFVKEMNPAQIVDSFKKAEEKELRDMRELRRQNMSKNPLKDLYCLCKSPFQGVMFNCQLCRDWFHEDCVPPQIGISNMTSGSNFISRPKWLCPSCVRSKRPRLEIILPLLVSLQRLPIRLPEDEALRCLAERAMNWQDRARKVLTSPDVTAALEAIIAQQRKQKRKGVGITAILERSSSHKQLRRRSIRSSKDNALNSDNPDSTDDDEGDRLHIVEDSLSNEEEELCNVEAAPPPELQKLLSDSEKENLNDLMMEGDLLEVSLDESLELWRILSAIQPICAAEAAALQKQHQIQKQSVQQTSNVNSAAEDSNDSLLVQSSPNSNSGSVSARNPTGANKKRRSLEPLNSSCPLPRKKTGTPNKPYSSSSKKTTRKSTIDANSKVLQADDAPDSKQSNGGSGSTNSNTLSGQKKRKRVGAISNISTNVTGQKKHSQRSQTEQQEDDEEECRAENCHKPTGREVDWVQCDGGCNEWFHMYCVGLNRSQIKADDDYFCIRCSRTMAISTVVASGANSSNHSVIESSATSTAMPIISTSGINSNVLSTGTSAPQQQTSTNSAVASNKGRAQATR
ncbi:PREDICTED: lysine-specific demethylase lid isoform X1 [Bactrocera latifrons]|uniref:[histone H3]-trimethyl-L-lysine(4) demethylase n=2 Tax=Bactrocera latifrons TaxID=174628 RepID=A0A0K8UBE1_BACLA|nr:PREDICTED: lysine-specific demethylase lid isoform X1 [Bactrocera latifrons]XP_018798280.1 PREDICTED: lysine-specific demethylase lid isoform X1 [Bactrocera latifrons]XP_018798282.1 PREDICTED: lysine-specific demethylase lid isoform X1 [Bactrocera latifrons]XP_018798283.1 PREDICTED: lysine-specific demethylase lid isoform X1 [Bactrocera latifrons]